MVGVSDNLDIGRGRRLREFLGFRPEDVQRMSAREGRIRNYNIGDPGRCIPKVLSVSQLVNPACFNLTSTDRLPPELFWG